jgi:hypothetical protein
MENIILAIIASVVYKFYQNYQEEMEKAAKRKQQQPHPLPPPVVETIRQQPRPKTRTIPSPPPIQIPEIRQSVPKKTTRPTATIRTESEIPTELTQAYRLKSERLQIKPLEVITADDHQTSTGLDPNFQFDLRAAILQSAILERPYK